MPRDPYEVLGVERSASADDITRAYRKLARKYHPDRNPGDRQAEVTFKEVQNAYDILNDAEKKARYDKFGTTEPGPDFDGAGGPFRWAGGNGAETQIDPATMQELLKRFGFGGGGGSPFADFEEEATPRFRQPPPPREAEAETTVPFTVAALGGSTRVSVAGREIDVKVPAGWEDGKAMRLRGQGPGGADLRLTVRVAPHPYFRREGNDVLVEVPLSLAEAALGAKVDVPTLDGSTLVVSVPAGTSGGARVRLKGRGIAGGNQFVVVKVIIPAVTDERGRALVEELARLHPQDARANVPWR